MDIFEIIEQRHSVRQYLTTPIEDEKRDIINDLIKKINLENNLNIQIIYDDENAFNNSLAHYGKFENVRNFIALVGKKEDEEKLGYFGEMIVLKAQEIGLNTCFVALTFSKKYVKKTINIQKDEKLHCVISIGYGKSNGMSRSSKDISEVLKVIGDKPNWLDKSVKACLLAPTAINQQKFKIIYDNGDVTIKKDGIGFYINLDLGIVKYHFDVTKKE